MNIINTLKSLDFFRTLSEKELEYMASISNIKNYSKNSILYYEEELKSSIQFLLSGLIKIYKMDKYNNEIFLYNIYQNSMISEFTSLKNDKIYCFSNAQISEDSKILSINYKNFKKNFINTGILTNKFVNEILFKTDQLQCILNRELVFDANSKVAYMLHNDLIMFNKLKRNEIAFMLHIQPETLSRVLKKLTRLEIIAIEKNNIIIKNLQKLSAIYTGVKK